MPPLIYCNWKTYLSSENDAIALAAVMRRITGASIALFPSAIHIARVAETLRDSPILLGAQDISRSGDKPSTGRMSGDQLADAGVRCVLVGHIETRMNGVTDAMVAEKTRHASESGITPVLCVNDGDGRDVAEQVAGAMRACGGAMQCVVAYEPADHVGTDNACDPSRIRAARDRIRGATNRISPNIHIPVLYGGSVDPTNAKHLISSGGVDGLLVGRASVDRKSIRAICTALL